jgi:molecular chaperone DnaJ
MQFSRIEPCRKCRGKGTVIENPCNQCRGAGTVQRHRRISIKIPPGVDTGSQLLLRGEGDAPDRGGPLGDLYVIVHVRPHQVFRREGDELICNVEVNFSKAALGGDMHVPTLDGSASIKLPAGTQSGAIFRLKKKGMPDLHDGGRGDELVVVRVRTPTKLTSRQKELLEQLSREDM